MWFFCDLLKIAFADLNDLGLNLSIHIQRLELET